MDYSNELEHFGVKGMKWGVRRAEKKAALNKRNRHYKKADREADRASFGKGGERRINRRMNKGKTHGQAFRRELARSAAISGAVSLGVTAITNPGMVKLGAQVVKHNARRMVMNSVNKRAAARAAKFAAENITKIGSKAFIDTTGSVLKETRRFF